MFLKVVRSAQNIDYVYVVEGYRDSAGRIRHRYLFSLGRLDEFLQTDSFRKLAKKALLNETEKRFSLSSISEGRIIHYGHCLIKKLWDKFNFDEFFRCLDRNKQFDIAKAVFYMTARHIIQPDSKLGMYEGKDSYIGFEDIGINHLYRALDVVAENKEKLEEYLFRRRYSLFNSKVDLVFYDVTTIYFESQLEDVLRKYGFSKDGKIGCTQIVLGLLIDSEGFPIGYDIFPGNSFDGKTLIPFLERIKKRFSLQRIIIVADRGINSKINLLGLRKLGFDYIVAVRLKNAGSKLLSEALNPEGYTEINTEEGIFKYKKTEHTFTVKDEEGKHQQLKDKVVICYSEKRAKQDRFERQRLIEKALNLLERPSLIDGLSKRGGKKYIKTETDKHYSLDEALIERDMALEGYYAIQTSAEDLKPEQILTGYHSLWKIEESFRIMKHTLELRPVFHWTEQRIRGHIVVCFLSFLFMRMLEWALDGKASTEKIRESLRGITFTEFELDGQSYYLKNRVDPTARALFKALKVKEPARLTTKEDFKI